MNDLPTRVRTFRCRRANGVPSTCRAGYQSTETAAHIVQVCHWTSSGRIKRRVQVCGIAANTLSQLSRAVLMESRLQLSIVTMLKPDFTAPKNGVKISAKIPPHVEQAWPNKRLRRACWVSCRILGPARQKGAAWKCIVHPPVFDSFH